MLGWVYYCHGAISNHWLSLWELPSLISVKLNFCLECGITEYFVSFPFNQEWCLYLQPAFPLVSSSLRVSQATRAPAWFLLAGEGWPQAGGARLISLLKKSGSDLVPFLWGSLSLLSFSNHSFIRRDGLALKNKRNFVFSKQGIFL